MRGIFAGMHIEWGRVTWYSQILAIALGIIIFSVGFCLGERVQFGHDSRAAFSGVTSQPTQMGEPITATASFSCDANKTIAATFHQNDVQLLLSDGRNLVVPHAISADGGRYANDDESFVFWTKGNGAFITEGSSTTYADCTVNSI